MSNRVVLLQLDLGQVDLAAYEAGNGPSTLVVNLRLAGLRLMVSVSGCFVPGLVTNSIPFC